jgi:hypothetical protein
MSARTRRRVLGVGLLALAIACAAACAETRRSLGEDCLKDPDCLSGICSALHCAASPPILGNEPPPSQDAGADAVSDASGEGGDAAGEGGDASEGGDGPTDGLGGS